MKREMIKKTLLVAAAWLLLALPAMAQETIRNFLVDATLTADRRFVVTETISYDFGSSVRHGIFRVIPETYERDGAVYRLRFKFLQAWADGGAVAAEVSRQNGNIQIRLGDPERVLTGLHVYSIKYETERAVNDVGGRAELYWNVVGHEWSVPIERASFSLHAPARPEATACFVGAFGSQEAACSIQDGGSVWTVESNRALGPNEGFTIVTAFNHSVIPARSLAEAVRELVADNIWLLFPFAVFFLMFSIWRKWGQEPRGRGVIIPEYEEPEGLTPALMIALLEQRVSERAITSTLLDLARRGHLNVKFQKDESIIFTRGQAPESDVLPYERTLWEGVFEKGKQQNRSLQDLKGSFWKIVGTSRKQVLGELVGRRFFRHNPTLVRAAWLILAGAVAFIGFAFSASASDLFFVSLGVSGLIIALFGWQMPQMTKRGAIVAEACQGFKRFLSVTEQARLAFTDAPERKPEQFARFLPAAVAFGVEKKWAEHFAGIDLPPPSYLSGSALTWNAIVISEAMGTLHSKAVASIYHAPSSAGSGGSGFSGGGSGGGFGGGGGGSW